MLFLKVGIGQNNQLQLSFKKTESSPVDSVLIVPIQNAKSKLLTDSISTSLFKKGYLNLLVKSPQKINDSLQQLEIILNKKYSYVEGYPMPERNYQVNLSYSF